ncbi:MAG: hypothetical protein COS89_07835 [Deltaproteobacteria bacterium CG07_land_8_20_14_0_80_38_7]|nr:MAG: hypothetical protein COS89_07835 [Deltaproteobacteria bacterium CG07_land_8_20_14_0_80_38_7]
MFIFLILIACINGILLSNNYLINASLGTKVGSLKSSFINHLVGALFAFTLLLIGIHTGNLSLNNIPLYLFIGGMLGIIAVFLGNYAIPIIGAMTLNILLISGQLITSAIIDHIGFMSTEAIELTPLRIAGIIFIILGAFLVLLKKQKNIPAMLEVGKQGTVS